MVVMKGEGVEGVVSLVYAWRLGGQDGRLGSHLPIVFGIGFTILVLLRVDGNLNGDRTSAHFLALESLDGLLLFFLVTNVDEAVTLAPPGLAPASADNPSRVDANASIGEQSCQTSIVEIESEVGDEEYRL